MERINSILSDNSNNDYILIKELSIYIKNHRDNLKPFDRRFVCDLVSIILLNDSLNILGIDTSSECVDGDIGLFEDDILFIFVTEINNIANNYTVKISDIRIIKYYLYLSTIVHELCHAKQLKNLNNELYTSSCELIDINYDCYDKNYDIIPTEWYAIFREFLITYSVLSYIYPEEKLYPFRKAFLEKIMDKYSVSEEKVLGVLSRFKTVVNSKKLTDYKIPEGDFSLFEKMYLGLDLSIFEYEDLMFLTENIDSVDVPFKKLIKTLNSD